MNHFSTCHVNAEGWFDQSRRLGCGKLVKVSDRVIGWNPWHEVLFCKKVVFIDGQLVQNIHSDDCYQVVGHVFMIGSSWMIAHEVCWNVGNVTHLCAGFWSVGVSEWHGMSNFTYNFISCRILKIVCILRSSIVRQMFWKPHYRGNVLVRSHFYLYGKIWVIPFGLVMYGV